MIKITFIEPDGTEHAVDAVPDKTLMEAAMHNGVPRIDADCGGMCACATCHVYIDPEWFAKTGEREGMEEIMLEFAEHVQPTSRLSCQVKVTAELDGLIVRLPESQH